MHTEVLVALISTAGSVITAVVALYLTNSQLGKRIDSIESRLKTIESDYKEFYRMITQIRAHLKMDE